MSAAPVLALTVALLGAARLAAADDAPDLPFGLLDRMRFTPFYLGATDEVATSPQATMSLTLHVQASTDCECRFSFYGTLPISIELDPDPLRIAAAGGPPIRDPRTVLGTADIGVFGGGRRGSVTTIFRVGALLPTGARDPHPWLPSARAGDRVLEFPRSAGVRTSISRQYVEDGADSTRHATFRVEAGIDVAAVLADPGNPVHVIPRAGAGMLVTHSATLSYSLDTALSADPFVDGHTMLRWSAGVTARYARHHGHVSFLQPAVTLATTYAGDGWVESLLVDLIATSAALADGYPE